MQRQKARDQTLLLTFLALSAHAEPYARKLEDKRLNTPHHIQKIVALSEIYGPQKVDRALQDAWPSRPTGANTSPTSSNNGSDPITRQRPCT